MSISPHVLIIGAGPGGLLLAQGLKKAGISFDVYDRDVTAQSRLQGYRFRIPDDAVKDNLSSDVLDVFYKSCGTQSFGMQGIDPMTAQIAVVPIPWGRGPSQKPQKTYATDRGTIRHVLLKGLDGHITWGKTLSSYTEGEDEVTAHFSDGSSVVGTLIVGADGFRSRVRKQLLPDLPVYDLQVNCFYGKTMITPELEAAMTPDILEKMTLISQPEGDYRLGCLIESMRFNHDERSNLHLPLDYIYWAFFGHRSFFPVSTTPFTALTGQEAKDTAIHMTAAWNPRITTIFKLADPDQTSAITIHSMDNHFDAWQPSARATLLGDAMHTMAPSGAMGATTALADAAALAKTIVGGVTVESIGLYEEGLRQRAVMGIKGSMVGAANLFNAKPLGDGNYEKVDVWAQ
jgi:2-polyprenyl-6-methoxyphenol hydroxylase-like FAD-dependent oxidoreductase